MPNRSWPGNLLSDRCLVEVARIAHLGELRYDFDRRRLECSEAAMRLLGIAAAGHQPGYGRILRQVYREDRRALFTLLGAASERGEKFETEFRIADGGGGLRWLRVNMLPIAGESGRVLHGTVMEVTEHRRARLRCAMAFDVARRLADAPSLADAAPAVIEAICLGMDWHCGVCWSRDARTGDFVCEGSWNADLPGLHAYIARLCSPDRVQSAHELPLRAVDAGTAVCIPDLVLDDGAPVMPYARFALICGLRSAWAFPIVADGKVLGVMECFSRDACASDAQQIAQLRAVGFQIGLYCASRRAEIDRRDSDERFQSIVDVALEPIIAIDKIYRIALFNPAAQRMFGYSAEEVIGGNIERIMPSILREIHHSHVNRFSAGRKGRRNWGKPMELLGMRADGVEFPVEVSISRMNYAGEEIYAVILKDIATRASSDEQIKFLANYDQVTSLPNRSLFLQRLERALVHAQRFNRRLAVMVLDLDRFKNINDTLGHDTGDGVLKEVAARLSGCVREVDTVARMGGDEFVVLIEQMGDAREAERVGHKLIEVMAQPLLMGGHECSVTASVGISTFPSDGKDAATLLKNADIAMYKVKEQGRNNVQFYAPAMNSHSVQRLTLESHLRRALQREEFLLHYQPKVDIGSGRVTGMEALVRWKRPDSGMVSPADFIPLAEETGLIVAIGEWVLEAACDFTHQWHRAGSAPLRVAVNLSARQFANSTLVSDVARILDRSGLAPEGLELEITESMVMGNPEQAIQTLRQLKSMGMSISMDDFGTGYSSLGYLKRFPLDHIKIDRSFIKDIPGDGDDATITKTIIAMAHNLRLKVIAEGVETEAQLDFLREHGCDEMQGYFFSRPLPSTEFNALIHAHKGCARVAA